MSATNENITQQVAINFGKRTYTFTFYSEEWADWFWREYQVNIRRYRGGTMAFVRFYTVDEIHDQYGIKKVQVLNNYTSRENQ